MYGKSYEISHSRLIEYRFDEIEYRFYSEFSNEKARIEFRAFIIAFFTSFATSNRLNIAMFID